MSETGTPLLDDLERGPWPSFVTEIKRAGKKKKAAYTASWRLLKIVEIMNRIAELDAPAMEKFEITRERINEEKSRIAFNDPRKLFHENGIPKEIFLRASIWNTCRAQPHGSEHIPRTPQTVSM